MPPDPFVDTNSVNISARVSGGMPAPLSATVILATPASRSMAAVIVTAACGRPSTASSALVTTFSTAREMPAGSKRSGGRSAGGRQWITASDSAARWATVSTMSSISAARSPGAGSGSRSLLNESMSITSDEILS